MSRGDDAKKQHDGDRGRGVENLRVWENAKTSTPRYTHSAQIKLEIDMSRQKHGKHGWGGKRPGAGRPAQWPVDLRRRLGLLPPRKVEQEPEGPKCSRCGWVMAAEEVAAARRAGDELLCDSCILYSTG